MNQNDLDTAKNPALPSGRTALPWLLLAVLTIIADQASKAWILGRFEEFETVTLLPVLDVSRWHNQGAAFSFLAGAGGWQRWLFTALAIVVSAVIVVWLKRLDGTQQRRLAAALTLVMGGAIGNVIDRIHHGYVVDFIVVHWQAHYFPAFNVADSCITIGAGLLILDALIDGRAEEGLMRILLANPRGFCAGVDRAIDIVERAIELFGAPIHVRHEVVHNKHVVERLRDLGAVFVEELDEVPDGATLIFSAHGVSSAVEDEAKRRGFSVFDATCPLVTKVHLEVARYARDARDVVLIGHAGHPEVEGTMGRFDSSQGGRIHLVENVEDAAVLAVEKPETLAFVTQTTLSVDDTVAIVEALRRRFPRLQAPRVEDICYATQNRQDAVKKLLEHCDALVVVGSVTSSNSNRLRELGERAEVPSFLVDGPQNLKAEWFEGKLAVGVTAGASAPELLVRQVVAQLQVWGGGAPVEVVGREENVVFSLPRSLRTAKASD